MSAFTTFAGDAPRLETKKIAAINRYVMAEMARQRIPGLALGIYKNGTPVLAKGYGMANVELNVPMSADSVLQSGSIAKSFTATAVMMLVERGQIKLDDSISKYFPQAPASWEPISIANLLSHTSGLPAYDTVELQKPGMPFDLRSDFSEDDMVAKIARLPINFNPGENWSYENTNFVLLGILIHRVTGQHYSQFLQENIFSPLGMKSTRIISDIDIVPNRAAGYEIIGGKLGNQRWVSPTFNATADGAMYFTIRDIAHWDRALYGESLLKRESLQQMWTPYPYAGKQSAEGFGFGWAVESVNGHRVIEHGGAWQGFTAYFSRYIDKQLTVVVLTNLDADHSNPLAVVRAVAGLVEPALDVAPRKAIKDEKADFSQKMWVTFKDLIKEGVKSNIAKERGLSAGEIEDLRQLLPDSWSQNRPELIDREISGKDLLSVYRTGKGNNKRLLNVLSNADDKIITFDITPDPDNR